MSWLILELMKRSFGIIFLMNLFGVFIVWIFCWRIFFIELVSYFFEIKLVIFSKFIKEILGIIRGFFFGIDVIYILD